jgi:transposase-like protein
MISHSWLENRQRIALSSISDEDLLAFFAFPHWPKLRATDPLVLVDREIGHRSDVVGIFPIEAAAIRLAGALLSEQNDEWLVCRRYPVRRAWPWPTLCRTTASESERTNRKQVTGPNPA